VSFLRADFTLLVLALEHLALRARLYLGPMRFLELFGALVIPLKDYQRRDDDRKGGREMQGLGRILPAHEVLQERDREDDDDDTDDPSSRDR
jgi:hypothetical protein